jgi:hypothetical protein
MEDGLVWSQPFFNPSAFHEFSVFDLSICSIKLFPLLSSNWHALVHTVDTCFSLPADIFDAVRTARFVLVVGEVLTVLTVGVVTVPVVTVVQ